MRKGKQKQNNWAKTKHGLCPDETFTTPKPNLTMEGSSKKADIFHKELNTYQIPRSCIWWCEEHSQRVNTFANSDIAPHLNES